MYSKTEIALLFYKNLSLVPISSITLENYFLWSKKTSSNIFLGSLDSRKHNFLFGLSIVYFTKKQKVDLLHIHLFTVLHPQIFPQHNKIENSKQIMI